MNFSSIPFRPLNIMFARKKLMVCLRFGDIFRNTLLLAAVAVTVVDLNEHKMTAVL